MEICIIIKSVQVIKNAREGTTKISVTINERPTSDTDILNFIHKCCSFFADELHFGMSYAMMRASCRNWSEEWTWNTSRMVEWMELGTWKIEFVLCSLDRKKETLAKLENSPWNISGISNTPCDRYIFFLGFSVLFFWKLRNFKSNISFTNINQGEYDYLSS